MTRRLPEITDETLREIRLTTPEEKQEMIDAFISSQPALYDRFLVLCGDDQQRLADMVLAATMLNAGMNRENDKRVLMRVEAIRA